MSDLDEQDQRIASIFGMEDVPTVSDKTLQTYCDYLKSKLDSSCEMTGIEDFHWEEYYIIGPGSKKEHEKLRKTQPSYLDTFKLIKFEDEAYEGVGILVKVRRTSDKKQFVLPLADLKTTDESHPNYQLLDDYSVWFANWM